MDYLLGLTSGILATLFSMKVWSAAKNFIKNRKGGRVQQEEEPAPKRKQYTPRKRAAKETKEPEHVSDFVAPTDKDK
jgi:hypothetical protein